MNGYLTRSVGQGTLIEASLIGCNAAGTDADREMIAGSRKTSPLQWPELLMPDTSRSLITPSITVSDLPYGQSVTIIGNGLNDLYHQALLLR